MTKRRWWPVKSEAHLPIKNQTWWPMSILAAFGVALFWEVIFLDRSFCYRDIQRYFLPYKHFYGEAIRHGVLPLWNPHLFCGMPFLATLQSHVLYPPNLLMALPNYPGNFTYFILFHYALSTWLMYRFAKRLGQNVGGACLAALTWLGSGYFLSVLDMVTTLCAVTWFPWALHAGWDLQEKFQEGWRAWKLHWIQLSAALLLMLLGGEPTVAYGTGIILIGMAFYHRAGAWKSLAARALTVAGAYVMAMGLGAAQFLPFFEYVKSSNRSEGMSYLLATAWSFPWLHYLNFVFPFITGDQMLSETHWYDVSQLWIKSPYVGIGTLILAWWGWKSQKKGATFFGLMALAGLILAMGKYTPIYTWCYHWMPGLTYFRYPVKFLFMAVAGLCLLGGFGFDRLTQESPQRLFSGWTKLALAASGLTILLFGLWVWNHPEPLAWIIRDRVGSYISLASDVFYGLPLTHYTPFLERSAARGLIYLIMLLTICWLYAKERLNSRITAGLFGLILCLDLLTHGWNLIPTVPGDVFRTPSDNITFLKTRLASTGERLYTAPRGVFAPGKTNMERVLHIQTTLDPNEPTQYGLSYAMGYESLSPFRHTYLMGPALDQPSLMRARFLTMMNVGYVGSFPAVTSPWLKLERTDILRLYRYTGPKGAARIVHQVISASTIEEAREAVYRESFDPTKQAVVERHGHDILPEDAPVQNTKSLLRELTRSIHRVSYEVDLSHPGYLVTTDAYDPGWKLYLDGVEGTTRKTNVMFRGAHVPAGRHTITFKYQPGSFYAGLWISGISLFWWLGLVLL